VATVVIDDLRRGGRELRRDARLEVCGGFEEMVVDGEDPGAQRQAALVDRLLVDWVLAHRDARSNSPIRPATPGMRWSSTYLSSRLKRSTPRSSGATSGPRGRKLMWKWGTPSPSASQYTHSAPDPSRTAWTTRSTSGPSDCHSSWV